MYAFLSFYMLMGLLLGYTLEPYMRRNNDWNALAFLLCAILWPIYLYLGVSAFFENRKKLKQNKPQ